MQHLILHLEGPLMSFGGETVDNMGVTRWFPSASMLTGLLANALGWTRTEGPRHQELQDRLVFAARIDREPAEGVPLRDFQTALLGAQDRGWTTRGEPERRGGGPATYESPHLRYREFLADMLVTVALRLEPPGASPGLADVAEALRSPARPLFIGRKPCLPTAPLCAGFSSGDSALGALIGWPLADSEGAGASRADRTRTAVRAIWPEGEAPGWVTSSRTYVLADQRNWSSSGLHGGGRPVSEGAIDPAVFAVAQVPDPDAGDR